MLPEIEELNELFEIEKEINTKIKCTKLISVLFTFFNENL